MRIDLTLHLPDGSAQDVAVTAADAVPGGGGVTVADLAAAMATQLPAGIAASLPQRWCTAHGDRLGGSGLRSGAILHAAPCAMAPDPTGPALVVLGGPGAGRRVPLSTRPARIGRDPACALPLPDPDVSRVHAEVALSGSRALIRDLGSTHGTLLDGARVPGAGVQLPATAVVRIGATFLGLAAPNDAPASVRDGPAGGRFVNRSPRARPDLPAPTIQLCEPPSHHVRPSHTPWLAGLLPAAGGVAMAVVMRSAQFLAFALLSPLTVLGSGVAERLRARRARRRATDRRRPEADAAGGRVGTALRHESRTRWSRAPDPDTVRRIARLPSERLWARHRDDADLLTVRLGIGPCDSATLVTAAGDTRPAGTLPHVPLGIDLRDGALGIAAPEPVRTALAGWLIGQLVTFVSPTDLELVLLLGPAAEARWQWARWLPHLRGRVTTSETAARDVMTELTTTPKAPDAAARGRPDQRHRVVVIEPSAAFAGLPGPATLLAGAGSIALVYLDEQVEQLPAQCRTIVTVDGECGSRLCIRDPSGATRSVIADIVDAEWPEQVARALAPYLDPGAASATDLPTSCRLLDVIDCPHPDADTVLARWRGSRGGALATLGIGRDGRVDIDLDRDGPHALVAGTTGSGKSELLQSLILGLAADHPPDELGFVLVDYKGGAAFAECARLPHCTGLVTDLDAHLTRRALLSLEAELRRRERELAAVGAVDLAACRSLAPERAPNRLVIVVDEFATLAEELPDFVSGLVGVAQRGRSLGIHLVLATQRPAGVVSAEIRANTGLRIALRVTDPADSIDVIDAPDAAGIDRDVPGRALVRAGARTVAVQVARVAGGSGSAPDALDTLRVRLLDGWRRLPDRGVDAEPPGTTDAEVLVDACVEAARRGAVRLPSRPWLPPLPELLPVGTLPATARTTLGLGLVDLPRRQRQDVWSLDLGRGGAVLLVGGARTGRTTTMLTAALVAAEQHEPLSLQVYALDFGGGLRALNQLPHTGTVACGSDAMPVGAALLLELAASFERRRSSDVAPTSPEPATLLVVDGWEALLAASDEHDAGRSVERLLTLVRDAAAHRLTVLVAGGRATLMPRLAALMTQRLLFELPDPADYALAGIAAKAVPRALPAGRAIRAVDGAHVQLAFAGDAPTPQAQLRAAEAVAARWRTAPAGTAVRIRALPERVELAQLDPSEAPGRWCVGVGGRLAAPVTVDLATGCGQLLVAGPSRSGRSTVLRSVLTQLIPGPARIVVAAPARSPLATAARAAGLAVIGPADAAPCLSARDEPAVLLVDDSESFLDTAAGEALTAWVRGAGDGHVAVVAARSDDLAVTYRGVATEVRRQRCGLLLQPTRVDGELLGVRLPATRSIDVPGRGVLVGDPAWGELFAAGSLHVQVALP